MSEVLRVSAMLSVSAVSGVLRASGVLATASGSTSGDPARTPLSAGASGPPLADGAAGESLIASVRRAKASARARCSSARCPLDLGALVRGVVLARALVGVRLIRTGIDVRALVGAGRSVRRGDRDGLGRSGGVVGLGNGSGIGAGGHLVHVVIPVGRSDRLAVAARPVRPGAGPHHGGVRVGPGTGGGGGGLLGRQRVRGGAAARLPRLRGETSGQRRAGSAGGQAVEAGRALDRPAVGGHRERVPRNGVGPAGWCAAAARRSGRTGHRAGRGPHRAGPSAASGPARPPR